MAAKKKRKTKKPEKMKMREFDVTYVVSARIKISEKLLESVLTPEWRKYAYDIRTAEGIAEHLVFNIAQNRTLTSLDGFADRSEDEIEMEVTWDVDDTTEVKP